MFVLSCLSCCLLYWIVPASIAMALVGSHKIPSRTQDTFCVGRSPNKICHHRESGRGPGESWRVWGWRGPGSGERSGRDPGGTPPGSQGESRRGSRRESGESAGEGPERSPERSPGGSPGGSWKGPGRVRERSGRGFCEKCDVSLCFSYVFPTNLEIQLFL